MANPGLPPGFIFSQSSLQDYMDCPRRFQLRYMDRLPWPAVETEPVLEMERQQAHGQLFHRLVQQHQIGVPADKLSRLAENSDLSRWWANYLGMDFQLTGYNRRPELTLSAPLGSFWLMAKYDLVAIKPGQKALIFDWKTNRKRPRDEWLAARMQTRIYPALLVRAGAYLNEKQPLPPELVEMVYWFADHPHQPARFPYSASHFERDWEMVAGLVQEISNHQVFPLTEDEKKCAYCPYRSYCNRGNRAGELEEMEAEMISPPEINFEQIAEIEF